MDDVKNGINFLKNFVKRRETYIRFSPIGTALMGFLYIAYYILGDSVSLYVTDRYLFLGIAMVAIIIVTGLSMLNSERKGEAILPASIKHIIINLFFITCTYFLIIGNMSSVIFEHIVASAFVFYGLLIIVSRNSLPEYIKYFGLVCFIIGALIFGPLQSYSQEAVLIGLGFGHIVIAIFLKINNDKDE